MKEREDLRTRDPSTPDLARMNTDIITNSRDGKAAPSCEGLSQRLMTRQARQDIMKLFSLETPHILPSPASQQNNKFNSQFTTSKLGNHTSSSVIRIFMPITCNLKDIYNDPHSKARQGLICQHIIPSHLTDLHSSQGSVSVDASTHQSTSQPSTRLA